MKKIIAILAVLVLVAVGFAVAGNAYGKVANEPCPRTCTKACTGKDVSSQADELATNDCIHQCLVAQCQMTTNSAGVCLATADDCCNIFATDDPDCKSGGGLVWGDPCDPDNDLCGEGLFCDPYADPVPVCAYG